MRASRSGLLLHWLNCKLPIDPQPLCDQSLTLSADGEVTYLSNTAAIQCPSILHRPYIPAPA